MKSSTIDTRLHFSKKDFIRKCWNKHMLGGALFAAGGAGAALLFTENPTPQSMALAALWTGIVAGATV